MTWQQENKLKLALGLFWAKPENGVMRAVRNEYYAGGPDNVWEELIALGYAGRKGEKGLEKYRYFVTEAGVKALEPVVKSQIVIMQ